MNDHVLLAKTLIFCQFTTFANHKRLSYSHGMHIALASPVVLTDRIVAVLGMVPDKPTVPCALVVPLTVTVRIFVSFLIVDVAISYGVRLSVSYGYPIRPNRCGP